MRPRLCLHTASWEPSGMGEHMLTLAGALLGEYEVSLVCPPGLQMLEAARSMGLKTLAHNPEWDGVDSLEGWLRTHGVDIFHSHAGIGWEGHDGVYAARRAGVPAVLRTEHLPYLITEVWQADDHRRMLREVDRLVCVSEGTRSTFVEAGVPDYKLAVVRNGIRPHPAEADGRGVRARLGLPVGAQLALTVGRMTAQKGHCYLLNAVPRILRVCPSTYFLWVGQGPLEPSLQARVKEIGVESHVLFLGRRDDVPQLMAASDLFVLPSIFEGLPLAALEAMAAGLPVVGTRVCGTSEAVKDGVTGRLVAPRNEEALAGAILEALENPGMAARWGSAGQRRARERFSAARMVAETGAIYQQLLLQAARPAVYAEAEWVTSGA